MKEDHPISSAEREAAREIAEYLLNHPNVTRREIERLKAKISKKFHVCNIIKNATVLAACNTQENQEIFRLLRRKRTRTLSGVSVIAVMTKPLDCPGKCIYCPGKNSQPGEAVAKSYTGQEPAARRSLMFNYDSRKQVASRIEDLEAIGHRMDKLEIICMGGTLCAAPVVYQEEFVRGCYEGFLNREVESLQEAKQLAETSERHLVGITFETRPDYCQEEHVNRMLEFGGTRVEIGVQTVFDDVYQRINRGHTTKETIRAFQVARDAGLKINAHMMPNLPGATLERDREMFTRLFENPAYRPDMLKIYPTLVIEGTQLYDQFIARDYKPYELEEMVKLIAGIKQKLPPYVRIQRVQRDIPAKLIVAGVKKSNLRELVQAYLKSTGEGCKCIRCREEGFMKPRQLDAEDLVLHRMDYEASEGREIFLSFETLVKDVLVGYVRLRIPSPREFRPELLPTPVPIVRELRVVGELVRTHEKPTLDQVQHRGFGTRLLQEVEKIAREEFDAQKIAVISGIGVRQYFYQRGYYLDGVYVSKNLPH